MRKKWIWAAIAALIVVALVAAVAGVMIWRQNLPTVYTSEELGYSFAVPRDCKVVDGKNAQSLLDEGSKEIELTDQVKAILEQAKNTQIVMMLLDTVQEKNFTNNMNVVTQDLGQVVDTKDLMIMSDQLSAQYQAMFQGFTMAAPCEIKTFGKRDVMMLRGEYTLNGVELTICQGFFMEGSMMYNLTLTTCREEFDACYPKMEGVLSTFKTAK